MKVGVYGDVHLTKNMRGMQSLWEESATSSIINMYKKFDEEKVEFAVCLGDFFDKPVIEAKSLHLVLPILNYINTREYPTYLLLGNHEIDDHEHNILEYLSEYDNIKPVTNWDIVKDDFLFIPYSVDPRELDNNIFNSKYVFTHHDIYGSELAGGKTKAFFGLDSEIFKDAKLVMNGHVHLKYNVTSNILNAGSLLVSQQGELRVCQYPSYYILDSDTGLLTEFENKDSMIYLSIDVKDSGLIVEKGYDQNKLVLRVDYEGELPESFINTAHTSWRKKITSIQSDTAEIVRTSNFDLKNYLIEYIKKDPTVTDKETYIKIGLEVLG